VQPGGPDPGSIVERLWPGVPATVEPIGTPGITTRNFRVTFPDDVFVLRLGRRDPELLGIDRRAEYAASVAAAELGVGPEVVAFLEPEGCLVTRWIDGTPIEADEARERDTIATVARLLRRIHGRIEVPTRFDPFRAVEAYHATAVGRGVAVPAAYARAKAVADMIERLIPPHPDVLCHNDLRADSVLVDANGRVWIIDWEYAGMGDRFFDLGTYSVNHGLDEEEDAVLLAAYGIVDHRSLMSMRFMADFREAMWAVVQQALSDADFDFVAHAARHFERMEQTAGSARFHHALL
jgi:thiamine kinase-like enzyme